MLETQFLIIQSLRVHYQYSFMHITGNVGIQNENFSHNVMLVMPYHTLLSGMYII